MGTTLRTRGLPSDACADVWVDERPDEVARVHQAFVDAGAAVVRTATLCTRPDRAPDAVARVAEALRLARLARPEQVWLSIGPAGPTRDAGQLAALAKTGADMVILETFVDGDEVVEAAEVLVAAGSVVIASMVPRHDGLLLNGEAPPWQRLLDAGVTGVGFNCGATSNAVLRAVRRLPPGGPWYAAPIDDLDVAAVWRQLAQQVRWLGGCCGVGPTRWRSLW